MWVSGCAARRSHGGKTGLLPAQERRDPASQSALWHAYEAGCAIQATLSSTVRSVDPAVSVIRVRLASGLAGTVPSGFKRFTLL